MRKIWTVLTLVALMLVSYVGTAFALAAADPAPDPSLYELARPVIESILAGRWLEGCALSLVLAAALATRYGGGLPKVGPFLQTGAGKALIVLVGSFGGALVSLGFGAAPSLALAWQALKAAFLAAGGYSMAKSLLVPLLEKLALKAPAKLRFLFDLVLWVFGRSTAIAEAEKAGADAVVAKPSTGIDGVVGKAEEF